MTGAYGEGWVRDAEGRLRRETKPHMGRRLPDFDYSARRIYEITLVLEERRPVLGRLVKRGEAAWAVEPSALGEAVLACWREIATRWPQVALIEGQLMPDHFHGVLFVKEALPLARPDEAEGPTNRRKTLGDIIRGFKAGATMAWRACLAPAATGRAPCLAPAANGPAPCPAPCLAPAATGRAPCLAPAATGRAPCLAPAATAAGVPRWAPGFVDTILFGKGQLDKMVAYLRDNPRRLGVKREHPELFKVTRALDIAGVGRFSAIGNHFLLSRPAFHQVQVSRRFFAYARDARGHLIKDAPPAIATPEFAAKLSAALSAARHGAVLVSPCISQGEREIARRAFAAGARVITLANKGFSPLYKPGGKLFETCAAGNLLMLAPAEWPYQPAEKPITRADALRLNDIARQIAELGRGRSPSAP